MKISKYPIIIAALSVVFGVSAQTMDCDALKDFTPAVQRATYDVCRYVNLDVAKQREVAKMVKEEDKMFVKLVNADGGLLTNKSRNALDRFHTAGLKKIMSEDELMQYYRGVYDAEASAEGVAIADRFKKKYNLTDQNWKFIHVAFYKIGLDTRVINKVYADKPKVAARKIKELREHYIKTIEEKGDIRVNPDDMTLVRVKPFDPNALHKG